MGALPFLHESNRAVGQLLHTHNKLTLHRWSVVFFSISLALWVYQQFFFAESLMYGIAIPDVVNISQTFENLLSAGSGYTFENQFLGLSVLYGWAWLLHPALCFLVNILLIYFSIRLYYNYFIVILGVPAWSIFGVLGNPYLVLAMIGPNKEIPLLLLTLVYFRAISQREYGWFFIAAFVCLIVYLFRDGYGAFLAGFLLLSIIFQFRAKLTGVIACLGCVAAAALFGLLETVIPILSRNREGFDVLDGGSLAVGAIAAQIGLDPLSVFGGFAMFCLRLIYNLLTMAVFPVVKTTSGIYLIGLSYWVFGIVALIFFSSCFVMLWSTRSARSPMLFAAALPVAGLFMISVSLFVQPRYLMPFLPLATAVFAVSTKRIRAFCLQVGLILSVSVIFVYWLLDRVPPLSEADSFDRPAYIIGS